MQCGAGIFFNEFPCGIVNENYGFGCSCFFDALAVAVVVILTDGGVVAVLDEGLLVLRVEGEGSPLGVGDDVAGKIVRVSLTLVKRLLVAETVGLHCACGQLPSVVVFAVSKLRLPYRS